MWEAVSCGVHALADGPFLCPMEGATRAQGREGAGLDPRARGGQSQTLDCLRPPEAQQ